MSLKTILLHASDPARLERLTNAAMPLARATNAHLIGLCVMPPYILTPAADAITATVTVDEHRIAYRKHADVMKAAFLAAAEGQTFGVEWREADAGFSTVDRTVIIHARTVDIVIVNQADRTWGYSSLLEQPESIAIDAGRPVLFVPNTGPVNLPPRRALIAWTDTREAARSAFDAAAILPPGCDVSVLTVDPPSPAGGVQAAAELCVALARHGFKCEALTATSDAGDVGAAIRHEARARGAELVVMGAYGHSRLMEFVFGGASRDIFTNAEKPILFSH